MSQGFLPLCRKDMEERGWEQVDFVYVCGDAYVGLEGKDLRDGVRRAKACISGIGGKYGLHGQPLFGVETAKKDRRLYAGRRDGETAGLCCSGVWQPDPADL